MFTYQPTDTNIIATLTVVDGKPAFQFSDTSGQIYGEHYYRAVETVCYSGKGLFLDIGTNVALSCESLYELLTVSWDAQKDISINQ